MERGDALYTKSRSRVLHIDDWSQHHVDICVIFDDMKQKLHFFFSLAYFFQYAFGHGTIKSHGSNIWVLYRRY